MTARSTGSTSMPYLPGTAGLQVYRFATDDFQDYKFSTDDCRVYRLYIQSLILLMHGGDENEDEDYGYGSP
jgi:hypothetical protein